MTDQIDRELKRHALSWQSSAPPPASLETLLSHAQLHSRRWHALVPLTAAVAVILVIAGTTALVAAHQDNHSSTPAGTSLSADSQASTDPPADTGAIRSLRALAHSAAESHGEHGAFTADAVQTTLAEAERNVFPLVDTHAPPGEQVWIVQIDGKFNCEQCPGDNSSDSVSLVTTIDLIVRESDYTVYGFVLGDAPADLHELGSVIRII